MYLIFQVTPLFWLSLVKLLSNKAFTIIFC